jgi:prepilin-type N-terminal cleavage/methylation domain-containing protein
MNAIKRTFSAGFTLLEVLVAVAITGGAIVVLLQAHSASVGLHEKCREMLISQHLIRELISEMEAFGYPGDIDEEQDVSDKYPGFKWRRTCRMLGEDMPGVYEVIVVISAPSEEYQVMTHLVEEEPWTR